MALSTLPVEPRRGRRRRLGGGVIIGLVISGILLFFALKDIRWNLLGDSLRTARPLPLLGGTLGFVCAYVVIGLRWKALLGGTKARFVTVFEILTIGLACNVFLPARGGDMVRVVILNQRERIRIGTGLSSLLLEKLFDVSALVVLLIPALIRVDLPRWALISLTLAVCVVGFGFGFCIVLARSSWAFGSLPFIRLLPERIRRRTDSFFAVFRDGVRFLFSRHRILQVGALSLLIWVINSVAAYLVLYGLRIEGVSLAAMFVVIAIMNLGLIIPSSPGYVGTYEFLGISALALFHVMREPALEFALVLHTMTLVIVLALGGVSMARMGYSLNSVPQKTALAPPERAEPTEATSPS